MVAVESRRGYCNIALDVMMDYRRDVGIYMSPRRQSSSPCPHHSTSFSRKYPSHASWCLASFRNTNLDADVWCAFSFLLSHYRNRLELMGWRAPCSFAPGELLEAVNEICPCYLISILVWSRNWCNNSTRYIACSHVLCAPVPKILPFTRTSALFVRLAEKLKLLLVLLMAKSRNAAQAIVAWIVKGYTLLEWWVLPPSTFFTFARCEIYTSSNSCVCFLGGEKLQTCHSAFHVFCCPAVSKLRASLWHGGGRTKPEKLYETGRGLVYYFCIAPKVYTSIFRVE